MSPTSTPGDEPDDDRTEDDRTRADSFGQPSAPPPPPPQWLEDGQLPPGGHLLPEAPGASEAPPAPEPPKPGKPSKPSSSRDKTVTDIDINDSMRTQMIPPDASADAQTTMFTESPVPQEPAKGPAPDTTVTDVSAYMKSAGTSGGGSAPAQAEDEDDLSPPTRRQDVPPEPQRPAPPAAEPPTPPAPPAPAYEAPVGPPPSDPFPYGQEIPPAQPPAPEPFPYAQDFPGQQEPLSAPPPFPYAQELPGQPPAQNQPPGAEPFPYAQEIPGQHQAQPPAAEPFPYAQEIPGSNQQPPAAEPFPYAQEIPGSNQQPPAAEPFPYAQEIPGQPQNQPPAADPFPYAQQVPARDQTVADMPMQRPGTPPPVIDEPWRTTGKGKKNKTKRSGPKVGKKAVLGTVGGLAAAALVAGGGYFLLSGGDDDSDGGGGATLAGKTFAADPAAKGDGRDQQLTSAASVGSTVVAVGGESGLESARGIFLTSTDGGRTYKPAAVKSQDGSEADTAEVPQYVAGGQHGWVAIGSRAGGGAVWTSQDGREWVRQPDSAATAFGPGNRVTKLITTGSGFLAIGENSKKGDFSDSQPAAWLSSDGQRWDALIGSELSLPALKGKVSLVDAAAAGNLILVESSNTPDPKKKPDQTFRRVWRSDDGGRSWAPAKVPAPKGTRGLAIGGGKAGLLVIREVKDKSKTYGQAYTSTDGKSWAQGGKLDASGYRQALQIMADDNGYAAVVVRGRDVLVSRTQDGRTWTDAGSLGLQPGRNILSGTLAGDLSILVGQDGGADSDPMLSAWDSHGTAVPLDAAKIPGVVRPDHAVTSVAAQNGRAVAAGSSNGDAALWTSQDGSKWTRGTGSGTALSRPGTQRLLSVTGGKSGWTAVGYDNATPRRPVVLTSADGASWQAADAGAEFKPAKDAPLTTFATASGPAGYVIVGDDGLSATTWFSADLKSWERGKGVGSNALAALPNSNRWMRSVAGGSFGYAAVGGIRDPKASGAGGRPAVWTSSDGKSWTLQQPTLPQKFTEGSLDHIAAKGNVLVATGSGTGGSGSAPFAYASSDGGKTWREVTLPAPSGAAGLAVTSLTGTTKGFAATGTTGKPGSENVISWTSADGTSWAVDAPDGDGLSGPGDQRVNGQAALGDNLVGVGETTDQQDEQPTLWTRPVP
ncbi:hypothetical protein J4573_45135 [Actinomadura barringtoniae]|uniref:Uncharacterized protein n=1 Tax=Actinomadura barringtoniae TaxID=1427535 RepID=A0A939PQF8_9ACTN|nr:sialidase family protein [Actinomadura barringtoniae]MBO2454338.1 hypothetical protein [Actinomadura barringtoniae]